MAPRAGTSNAQDKRNYYANRDALARTLRMHASVLFQPPLAKVNLLDWQDCDRAIDIGYRYAIEKLKQLDKSSALRSTLTRTGSYV